MAVDHSSAGESMCISSTEFNLGMRSHCTVLIKLLFLALRAQGIVPSGVY